MILTETHHGIPSSSYAQRFENLACHQRANEATNGEAQVEKTVGGSRELCASVGARPCAGPTCRHARSPGRVCLGQSQPGRPNMAASGLLQPRLCKLTESAVFRGASLLWCGAFTDKSEHNDESGQVHRADREQRNKRADADDPDQSDWLLPVLIRQKAR